VTCARLTSSARRSWQRQLPSLQPTFKVDDKHEAEQARIKQNKAYDEVRKRRDEEEQKIKECDDGRDGEGQKIKECDGDRDGEEQKIKECDGDLREVNVQRTKMLGKDPVLLLPDVGRPSDGCPILLWQ